MHIYNLPKDIKVFGSRVKSLPAGISEAFDKLVNKTGEVAGLRSYYGISYVANDGQIIYTAAAEAKDEAEANKYNYECYTIEKGNYLSITVNDWRRKTDCIKDVFHELMKDARIDRMKPCIEWYKNEDEMMCMAKMIHQN